MVVLHKTKATVFPLDYAWSLKKTLAKPAPPVSIFMKACVCSNQQLKKKASGAPISHHETATAAIFNILISKKELWGRDAFFNRRTLSPHVGGPALAVFVCCTLHTRGA